MREVFDTAKRHSRAPLDLVPDLLQSDWYEMRMVGMAMLDFKTRQRGLDQEGRRELYEMYMDHHDRIRVWDLVDRAAPRVLGWYLFDKSRQPLYDLAESTNPLERRSAITAAFWFIRKKDLEDPLALAHRLAEDPSDLVRKPVGTALREVGKVDREELLGFLRRNSERLSRVTVRYAIERLPEDLRSEFLLR